ncbi:hypothetical protein VFPPC_10611 [Pochonia chlamydosporia 170]|uniref:Uncharacterized protein n=1 Tax=Pochonia chlamydosporia 170 TaxID=1380566 RepID=A0A179F482_METCM|nr:hypothetical protein VFPPC_10611 [Pochonia chlamydosporia 170]OAQ60180.2 hypothetical protein VFPPC_10611 [Pochonia chlamydosporia 170]
MIEIGLGDEPVDPSHENNLWVDCDDADESMSEPTPANRNSPNVNAEYTLHTDPEGREQPSDQESTPFITDVHIADSTVQRPMAPAKREINMLRQRTARSAAIPSHIAQSRVQKSTKPAKKKLLAASAPELRQSLIPNEPSDEGMAENGGISMTVGNLAVTQLPSNNQLGPEKRSNITGCTQVPVNEVRVYYLEDNCWKLVGSHSRESIGRAVRTFLRQSGNALYLFDSEERGIQPSDCHEVGDPVVCITSDSKGFGDAGPPEEVEL